jgi:alpha-mannosidase
MFLENIPGMSASVLLPLAKGDLAAERSPLLSEQENGSFVLQNNHLACTISPNGFVSSLVHKETGREVIKLGSLGNAFCIFDDVPLFWDAWDTMEYHIETRKVVEGGKVAAAENGLLRKKFELPYRLRLIRI